MIAVHVDYPTNYARIEMSSLDLPPPSPLFLDQTEARRAEESFLGDRRPSPPPPFISRSGSGTVISLQANHFSAHSTGSRSPYITILNDSP